MNKYRKKCVNTIGASEVMPERSITACFISPTDEKLTLKTDTEISRLKFVPRKKEQMTVILSAIYKERKIKKEEAAKTKQVQGETKVQTEKTLHKRKEFLKYLQSTNPSFGIATKTDSNAEWWEKRIGVTRSVLS